MLPFHFKDTLKTLVYILDQLMTSLQANLTSEFSEVLTTYWHQAELLKLHEQR